MFYICIIIIKTKTKMEFTKVIEKLEYRIETLEKILLMFPSGKIASKEERVIMEILIETKKEYKLQMYQD